MMINDNVHSQVMKNLEQMAPHKAHGAGIELTQIQVLVGSVPNCWTIARENEWILQIALGRHHTANARRLNASLNVTNATNVAVGKDWHVDALAHLLDDAPVRNSRQWAFHLPRTSVNCQQLCAGTFEHLSVPDGLLVVIKASYLAGDGHAEMTMEGAHFVTGKRKKRKSAEEKKH